MSIFFLALFVAVIIIGLAVLGLYLDSKKNNGDANIWLILLLLGCFAGLMGFIATLGIFTHHCYFDRSTEYTEYTLIAKEPDGLVTYKDDKDNVHSYYLHNMHIDYDENNTEDTLVYGTVKMGIFEDDQLIYVYGAKK